MAFLIPNSSFLIPHNFIAPIMLLAILTMASCNNSQPKDDTAATDGECCSAVADSTASFNSFTEHFSKTAAFAYAKVSDRQVLLVSQETFGNNQDSDLSAVEASIFALDKEGKIVSLGSIRSQGTLYPVSILDGKLMVAGHQFVKIYSIRGETPELVLDSYGEGEVAELTEMFNTFERGTAIKFEKAR